MYARADAPVAAVPNEMAPNDSDGYTKKAREASKAAA